MINKDELIYKLEAVIEYLKNNGGYDYELYNRLCPGMGEPDSNIVEYAEDVLQMVNSYYKITNKDKLCLKKYYNYIIKIKGLDELTSFALDFSFFIWCLQNGVHITDKADAFALTQYLMANTYKPNSNRLYHIYSLKSLCRTRDRLVRERSKFKVYITNELDKSFPEIKKFFDNKISITLLYILEKYKNKNKIALMKDYDSIRKVSAANFSFTRFLQLKQLAKESIGHPNETSDFLIESYVKSINCLSEQISSIEKQIIESVRNLDTHILTIPGIAEISAGSIIAEFGDIKNFESPEKMLAFAGLEPSIRQSGTLSTEGHMVKHGSGYLRNTIMRVVNSLVMHDQVFYDYYNKKRDEGKHHLVAQSHVAKKLIRVIYTLETKGIDYDINFVK